MSQGIRIPVSAQTGDAKRNIDDLANATTGVADAVRKIEQASGGASAGIRRMADSLREVQAAQRWLSGELGTPVSDDDAKRFLDNFQTKIRANKGGVGRGAKAFDSFEDWTQGHGTLYGRNAQRYRQFVLGVGMQGTDHAKQHGTPGPMGGAGHGSHDREVERAKSSALSFGKSMLALAGITSVMGMAARGIDNATEEATGVDTLKRRLGDLGVEFESLRLRARGAAEGLGVTFVESQRLAQSYVKAVGNLTSGDLAGLGGSLRLGMGMSRGYGLELEQGNQFFASLAHYGVAKDEASQRRFAMLIGDSVARSGYTGKVDELMSAVADYTAMSAKMTLTSPNSAGFLGAMTALLGKGYAGMGPSGAAALIGQADSAMRRGGAMGEASMNFLYNAFRNFSPDLSPVDAIALMEGGLFASTASTFGGKNNPLSGRGPGQLDSMTNIEKVIRTLSPRYRDPGYLAEAVKGLFGQNIGQAGASALLQLQQSGGLGASLDLLKRAGVNPGDVDVANLPALAQLANAKGRAGLDRVGMDLLGRSDLTDGQREALQKAMRSGDEETSRRNMARAIATFTQGQEATEGTKTRQSLADLNDTLTKIGDGLLGLLNPIRDAVVAIAQFLPTGYIYEPGGTPILQLRAEEAKAAGGVGRVSQAREGRERAAMRFFMSQGYSKAQAAGIVGNLTHESAGMNVDAVGDGGTAFGLAQWRKDRLERLKRFAKDRGTSYKDFGTQLAFVNHELKTTEQYHGRRLMQNHSSIEGATGAVVGYERPKGYHASIHNYENAHGWNERLSHARRLYAMDMTPPGAANQAPAAPAQKVDVTARLEVVDQHGRPKGQTEMKPVGTPRPAGAVGGRAPLIGGTIRFPVDR